jgi:hypothetical protein
LPAREPIQRDEQEGATKMSQLTKELAEIIKTGEWKDAMKDTPELKGVHFATVVVAFLTWFEKHYMNKEVQNDKGSESEVEGCSCGCGSDFRAPVRGGGGSVVGGD